MIPLKDKVVFITGSSIGIGRADAYKFARQTCNLVITYYQDKEEGEKTRDQCLALGSPKVLLLHLDITSNNSINKAMKQITDNFGYISILINNAGVIVWKEANKQLISEIENQIRVNLEGLIKISVTCLPYIQDMIINMGSASSITSSKNQSIYSASKWGVRGFTQALAKEAVNIKIYNFISGGVATRMKNFQGISPDKIADLIVDFAGEKYTLESGSDVNARDY